MDLCNRYPKQIVKILTTGILAISFTACSGGGSGSNDAPAELTQQGLSCPDSQAQAKSNAEDMSIQNSSEAAVGETVQYKLNTDALCSGAQKVTWSMPGAQKVAAKVDTVSAQYSAPGDYYVSAKLTDGSTSQTLVTQTMVMGEQIQFSGRQVTTKYFENTFSLTAPAGVTFSSIVWNFGDGQSRTTTAPTVTHAYNEIGEYNVNVAATTSDGVVTIIDHVITVIQDTDEMFCAVQLIVSTPSETRVGDDNVMSIFIPNCLGPYVQSISWNYGDSTSGVGATVHKTYSAVGDYTIRATIRLNHAQISTINITRRIQVNEAPVDNNKCPTQGNTRTTVSDPFDETEACGIKGHKPVTYQNRKLETCERVEDILDWVLTSTVKELVSEGPCQGQACPVPAPVPAGMAGLELINGAYYLADGLSFSFYTEASPGNSCEDVKVSRTCTNGVLGGSSTAILYSCQSGCGDFGPNGTVKTGINVGTRQVPVTCAFGEQGIFDLYNEIEDRMCTNGSVNNSNLRLGDLISKGQCPTYSYQPTGLYGACSADCGGSQSMIYDCRSNTGEVVSADRCAGQAYPSTTRVCDGNPEAVRRVEVTSVDEQVNSTNKCPKNQIGVIVNNREAITTKTYACIDHAVGLESTNVEYTPWVEERFCRDYIAHRCNNDSLSNSEAHKRYLWMKKCAPSNDMIREFLEQFDDVNSGMGKIDGSTGRTLYPTFMNSAYKPEKLWKAPIAESASCNIPEGVYVAAVCVSSCSLPDEKILAQLSGAQKMGPVEFVKALTKNYNRVATLTVNSSLNSKQLKNSSVEQWVSELVDTTQPVLVFRMASGNSLSITPNHPVLRPDGSMDVAEHFKAGDHLVKLGGEVDPIVSIDPIEYYGKVYNVFVKSAVPQENIVVTNGYLNGSAFFQNEGAIHLNKDLVRKKLTKGIFDR